MIINLRFAVLAVLCLAVSTAAPAQKNKVSFGLSLGVFVPQSSAVRDSYGSTWFRAAFKTFEEERPTHWQFIGEVGSYRLDGPPDVRIVPITVGFERAMNKKKSAQPYIALRAGPYFGNIRDNTIALDDSNTGLNINAAYGVTFKRRFYVEARYDYFSPFSGSNFSGFSLSAGMKLFDIRL